MRFTRTLVLLALSAFAMTVFAAPSAVGQTEPLTPTATPRLLVEQEIHAANDIPCPPVVPNPPSTPSPPLTSGGCRVHFKSSMTNPLGFLVHLSAGGTEVVISTCAAEFDVRIDNAGKGWMSHQEYTAPPMEGTCTRRPCGATLPHPPSEGRAHSLYLKEVSPPAVTEQAVGLFCFEELQAPNAITHCEISLSLIHFPTHRYRFLAGDVSGHGSIFPHCEISGSFDVETTLGTTGENEAEQNIEIRHTLIALPQGNAGGPRTAGPSAVAAGRRTPPRKRHRYLTG